MNLGLEKGLRCEILNQCAVLKCGIVRYCSKDGLESKYFYVEVNLCS
ncbi:hypothetical protein RchiOBHm_Chr2g0093431 [Rosa chinensis]|uniref:Uncharacterized protein n=1 Tax=Rosa chinensis TaxID=74649 RepID=A0A2P6RK93_ROSCH|nr:hypothetical protein RchiOBHm_Chr2g0093431 [Rosa chinensis]